MKLVYPEHEIKIYFEEGEIQNLIIENQDYFSRLVFELYNQIKGEDGRFVLSEGDKIKSISKNMHIILSPITISTNEKKLVTRFYKGITEGVIQEDLMVEYLELKSKLCYFFEIISEKTDLPMIYSDDFTGDGLMKLMNTKIENLEGTLVERIVDYIKIYNELMNINIFAFINLKAFLSENDLKKLFQFAGYQKIQMLLIDGKASKTNFENERIYIIDEDLCEIY